MLSGFPENFSKDKKDLGNKLIPLKRGMLLSYFSLEECL